VPISCGWGNDSNGESSKEEIRIVFREFQLAIRENDLNKLWDMADADFHAFAEQQAIGFQSRLARSSAEERSEFFKEWNLDETQDLPMNGKVLFKSKAIRDKLRRVLYANMVGILPSGDRAMIIYKDADGESGQIALKRETDSWKMALLKF
jgi:hypothetical protein